MKTAAVLCMVLTSIVLGGCASYEGGYVSIKPTDMSNVKPGVSRAIIEQNLGEPIQEKQEGSWVLAEYKYQFGAYEKFRNRRWNLNPKGLGQLLLLPILYPVARTIENFYKSHKAWWAERRLRSELDKRVLTVLYSGDEKAQWVGWSALSAHTFQKATTGDPAAQLEVGVKSLNSTEQWKWVCRSANQGNGPALSVLEATIREHATDAATKLLNPKWVRIAREIDDDLNRKAGCDPEKPFELDMSHWPEMLRDINIPDATDRINYSTTDFGSLRATAKCGVADAQDWLGLRFQEGEGTAKNLAEAYIWYGLAQRNAKIKFDRLLADHRRAIVRVQLTSAQIVETEKRIEVWRRDLSACAQPTPPVDYQPAPLDKDKIAKLCPKVHAGDAEAQYAIGYIFEDILNPYPIDPMRAYVWYSVAEKNGYTHARAKQRVADLLTPEQIAEGDRLIAAWKPEDCALEAKALANKRASLSTSATETSSPMRQEAAGAPTEQPTTTQKEELTETAKQLASEDERREWIMRLRREAIKTHYKADIEEVKRDGRYEDCDLMGYHAKSDCEERAERISELQKQMSQKLAELEQLAQ